MSSKWYRLNLSNEDLPPLLFQYSADRQGYGVYVTDLTTIWSERLSHGEILGRADQTATTIDPSEDSEQLDVLLAKIGEALRGDGGRATLNSGSDVDSLELTTSTKLPAPLQPLRWPFKLGREEQHSLTNKLLLPLLREEAGWESRQRALLDQLKQKDWVLGKLLDKAEALSVDLGTVFPGAAGLRSARKGSTWSEVAKLIKGIAPFDESAWLAESDSKPASFGLAANLFHEIVGSHDSSQLEKFQPAQDEWWSALQPRSETPILEKKEPVPEKVQPKTSQVSAKPSQVVLNREEGSATESEDDGFQVRQPILPSEMPSICSSFPSEKRHLHFALKIPSLKYLRLWARRRKAPLKALLREPRRQKQVKLLIQNPRLRLSLSLDSPREVSLALPRPTPK